MGLYTLTIFLSALLLFQVELLIAKYILPWFGGGPAIWTTCMLFFQTVLLAGYAYAHLVRTHLAERRQVGVHVALIAGAALLMWLLPIAPSVSWKPEGGTNPTWRILLILAASVGLPYFALSATSPLLQAWFSVTHPGRSPYRLYALSNAGSLLALATYPFLIEPHLRLGRQATAWSIAFYVFVGLCGLVAVRVALRARRPAPSAPGRTGARAGAESAPRPSGMARLLWLALPACGSVMLLAVTNQLCADVAVVPFLWVLPLGLYLLSFILCFQSERIYWRPLFWLLLGLVTAAMVWLLFKNVYVSMIKQIVGFSAGLFVCCMVCHGELARLKPSPRYLTSFYLMFSAGGAVGGLLVTLVAPLVFPGYYELHLGLWACFLLATVAFLHEQGPGWYGRHRAAGRLFWFGSTAAVASVGFSLAVHVWGELADAASISRNFYGVLKVEAWGPRDENGELIAERTYCYLRHGRILHGCQYVAGPLRYKPTKYYWEQSGVGLAILNRQGRGPMRVGVVGLGVGTIAAYGRDKDTYRFYEINPAVLRLSGREDSQFTYVKDCRARGVTCEIVMGDARLSLERESPQQYDILALDAFTSDAIPVHLLTEQAFRIYRRHLKSDGIKSDGILAVHISNRFLDLRPVVLGLAERFGMQAAIVPAPDDERREEVSSCTWVLVTEDKEFLRSPAIYDATAIPDDLPTAPRLWTDDYSDLFTILR